jgi:hypothetical protein
MMVDDIKASNTEERKIKGKTPIIGYRKVNPGFLKDSLDSILKEYSGYLLSHIEGPNSSYMTYIYDIPSKGGIVANIFYSPYAVKFNHPKGSGTQITTDSKLTGLVYFLGFQKDEFYHKLYYHICSIGE